MAMTRVEPVEVRVRTDWLSGRPREIRWGRTDDPRDRDRGRAP
jgi:hypothetical protein